MKIKNDIDIKNVSFAIMTGRDIDEISLLEMENFSRPWTKQDFKDFLKNKNVFGIVARYESELIGCCMVRNILGEGEITNVQVKHTFRGHGVARKMLEELLLYARKSGIMVFTLEVRVNNLAAVHIYEELGFVKEGIRPEFYDTPKEDALIMWKR